MVLWHVDKVLMFSVWDLYISGTEYNCKFKFSMQTHLTHTNTIFEYCNAI